ncbi:plant cysteine oxidase 4-like [Glycine soja]|uniref:cysteine dioxygenase n=1 Tax=Glycine soja TaxID=3848 RepID=A0A445H773_GLYSO|nr:plant cysteine oxidase 4-like [Glycine soja]RZB69538.1 Plant cysteine oxidase 4 [Glycine soja]
MERSKIQVLYDASHAVFSQEGLPTFQQIDYVKNLLDKIEAMDVGIDEFGLCDSPTSDATVDSSNSKGLLGGQGFSEITYIHIHECDYFSMGVFCIPAGKVFPLHDHPGMTVLSKLLYGSAYVKAYDWIALDCAGSQTIGLAGRVVDEVFKAPHEPSILFPRSGGNIHSFTALTPCAILDVLSPPYSEEFGRPSTYFSDIPIPSLNGYAILEEKPMPSDLVVQGAPYLGPSIVTVDDYVGV